MKSNGRTRIESILGANTRIVAYAIMLVLLLDVMVAVRHSVSSVPDKNLAGSTGDAGGTTGTTGTTGTPIPGTSLSPTPGAPTPGSSPTGGKTLHGKPGTYIPGYGHIPQGVTDKTIDVVYYWKGDRTMTSPYLGPTGQKG